MISAITTCQASQVAAWSTEQGGAGGLAFWKGVQFMPVVMSFAVTVMGSPTELSSAELL